MKSLLEELILKYPNSKKPYTPFTDTGKYAWVCRLTQSYEHEIDGKFITVQYPITYQRGLYRGKQLNWAALTKEVYAIYMSIKKLTNYLEDADITLKSDHLLFWKLIKMCYATIKLTLIGLKQPLVTSQSEAREARMLSQHAKCSQAIPAYNHPITGQEAIPACSHPIIGQGSLTHYVSMQLRPMTCQEVRMLSQHAQHR